MKRLKNITILLCFLSLLAFISCSAEDKTGVANNPPEDTEIVDGETGSGGTGSGSSSGGSSGTETDGGSEEGESGTEPPPTPSEPEILTTEIEAKDFPPELLGTYRDERLPNEDKFRNAKVSLFGQDIWIKGYQKFRKKDGSAEGIQDMDERIKKWKKTTKGGKIIKLEGESLYTRLNEKNEKITVAKTVITFDYESKTVSLIFTAYTPDGVDASFYGKKIG